jgi:hypothetical protein
MQLEWIFALVVFFLWIVNYLLRGGTEDDKRPERARQAPGDIGNPARRPRRQPSDIDRFLEEVRRRRETQERRPQAPAPAKPPAQVVRQRPSQQPSIERRPVPTQQPSIERRPPPTQQPAKSREVERQPVIDVIPLAIPVATALSASPIVSAVPGPPQPQPAQPFLEMLRQPESLVTAIMIREVLGPPVCRRNGGRR